MTWTHTQSSLSVGFRRLRMLFKEERAHEVISWTCMLCDWNYWEDMLDGAPEQGITPHGLFLLAKHMRGHITA